MCRNICFCIFEDDNHSYYKLKQFIIFITVVRFLHNSFDLVSQKLLMKLSISIYNSIIILQTNNWHFNIISESSKITLFN